MANLKIAILGIGITTSLLGCGSESTTGAAQEKPVPQIPAVRTVQIDMSGGRTPIPVELIDAKTGDLIDSKAILRVSDDDSTQNFHENDGLETDTGDSIIFIKPNVLASFDQPVHLRVLAQADGYFSSSLDFSYTGKTQVLQIYLTKKSDPPAGVAVATQQNISTSATGVLEQPISLVAKVTDPISAGASASFMLPEGTILKDRTGAPLSGKLDVTIAYFSPNAENISSIFPGGLNPERVRVQGADQRGYFITGGLLAVDIIDQQGRKAHILEGQKAQMSIQTPSGFINPDTKQALKAGDTVPIWSHNESSGLWSQEQIGVYQNSGDGNLEIKYSVKHLSYWNLDWHYEGRCAKIKFGFEDQKILDNANTVLIKKDDDSVHARLRVTSAFEGFVNVPPYVTKFEFLHDTDLLGEAVRVAASCDDVLVFKKGEIPPPTQVKLRVILKGPSAFNKDQVSALLDEMKSLEVSQKQKAIAYMFPVGEESFVPQQSNYNYLMRELGFSVAHIQAIQTFGEYQVVPTGYVRMFTENPKKRYFFEMKGDGLIRLDTKDLFAENELIFKSPFNYSYVGIDGNVVTGTRYPTRLFVYVPNSKGNLRYYPVAYRKNETLKFNGGEAADLVFEDLDAMKRAISFIKANKL